MFNMGEESKVHPCGIQNTSGQDKEEQIVDQVEQYLYLHKVCLCPYSGFWGLSRHMNYVFELMLALSWSLPAIGYGVFPFFYFVFLVILLVHR
jgi:hypothetical protein